MARALRAKNSSSLSSRTSWSASDDGLLGLRVSQIGKKWEVIAKEMEGRTGEDLERRWEELEKERRGGRHVTDEDIEML